MASPPRIEFPGALYHVTSRGNARQDIFLSDDDRVRFIGQLQHCLEQYDVKLFAYALMSNHYHLFVQPRRANLSRFCQRLNTSYSLYARYRHKKPGHVFQGRYRAKLVEDESYLSTLTRYIHLNPVKTKLWRSRPLAEREGFLFGYPWSSLPGYVRRSAAQEFMCYDALLDFGSGQEVARRAYRRFIIEKLAEDDPETIAVLGASPYAVGGREFVRRIEDELKTLRTGRQQDLDLTLPDAKSHDLTAVDRSVCEALRLRPPDLRRRGYVDGPGARGGGGSGGSNHRGSFAADRRALRSERQWRDGGAQASQDRRMARPPRQGRGDSPADGRGRGKNVKYQRLTPISAISA